MQTISIKIPDSLAARLAELAKRTGRTKSAIIRQLLEEHLSHGNAARGSVLELAGDLIGCAEGPGDLPSNAKGMEGYGQ